MMIHGGRRQATLLFIGDIFVFAVALWLTLFIRYAEIPTSDLILSHLAPFSMLFVLWVLVFYISGLYGKGVILLKSRWPRVILNTQFVNVLLAALFFFLFPGIGITPKTSLIIYLVVSLVLIFGWRLALYPRISFRRERYRAALIASGKESKELVHEVNGNDRYHMYFAVVLTPEELEAKGKEATVQLFEQEHIEVLVTSAGDPTVESLISFVFEAGQSTRPQMIPFVQAYEEVFDRVPLSLLSQSWLIKQSSDAPLFYSFMKRAIDIGGGLLMGIITLIAIPFVFLAQHVEGKGPLFITQERIGKNGSRVKIYKFRSMSFNDAASATWVGEKSENKITKVGNFLRKTSLDEFPQFINVLKGEISLIGPRSDIEGLGIRLAEEIPYYKARYLVTPGITGWAQINQQYEQGNISPQSIEETKVRLAYDFYYIKYRSLGVEIVIALKTMKRMFFRVSSW